MKRFVTYLYEYDRTLRGRNVGFIRNDIRSDCCRMEIHIRGLERIKEKAPIYIIVRSGDCIGIPAGEIVISQGAGNACLELQGDYIGKTSYRLRDMQAVLIRYQHGKMLMGCYVQHPASDLLRGTFQVWEAERGADDDSSSKSPASDVPRGQFDDFASKSPASDVPRGQFDDSCSKSPAPDVPRGQFDDSGSKSPASDVPRGQFDDSGSKSPAPDVSRGQFEDFPSKSPASDVSRGQFEDFASENPAEDALPCMEVHTEEICQDEEDKSQPPIYKRIAITDIRALPAPNWHLCSNSFLVHGFFCYHYLILKTEDAPDGAKMYLGVPGTYSDQERMMALLFGFSDFETALGDMAATRLTSDRKCSASDHNTTKTLQPFSGGFGYWLCPLET